MHAIRRPGAPPTLVALHGFAGTGADWERLLDRFPNASVLPDLPGHGATTESAASFASLADMLEPLPGPAEAAVWIGYSFGARCLFELALRHPRRVAGLVLVGAHPGLPSDERVGRAAQDEADARLLEGRGLDAFLEAWHSRPIFASRRGRPDWPEEVRRKKTRNRAAGLAETLRRLGLGAQPDYRRHLAEITAPTLWVTGGLDETYTRLAADCAPRMMHAEHVVIEGAGHGAHLEEPQAFQDILARFLASLGTGMGGRRR